MYNAHSSQQCTMHTVHINVQCTQFTSMYNAHSSQQCTMHTVHNNVQCTQFTPRIGTALCTKGSLVTHTAIENTGCSLTRFHTFKIKMNFIAVY